MGRTNRRVGRAAFERDRPSTDSLFLNTALQKCDFRDERRAGWKAVSSQLSALSSSDKVLNVAGPKLPQGAASGKWLPPSGGRAISAETWRVRRISAPQQ